MTGRAADAEDRVPEAWLRFASADRDNVQDMKAFLVTIVTRLALDRLKSAGDSMSGVSRSWRPTDGRQ